jgi:GMP synthase (glutamine-hydrolysing)
LFQEFCPSISNWTDGYNLIKLAKNLEIQNFYQRLGDREMKSSVVIRHLAFEDLGTLSVSLQQRGYSIKYVEAGVDSIANISALEPDLVVILGGPIGVYDEADYPFLIDEINLLQQRLAADLPTLGICLGAQLMAKALGAKVYAGGQKEIGWFPISLREKGLTSPLQHLQRDGGFVLHWHGDTFTIPVDAHHLAASEKYENQAFSWKDCGLALQFHPEVTAQGLEQWFIGHAGEISTTANINVSQLRADSGKYAENLVNNSSKMWEDWLIKVEQSIENRRRLSA